MPSSPGFTRVPLRPTVQLHHEMPDGTSHVDWLLARDATGETPLVAFRLAARIDGVALSPGPFVAERLADHRAVYLDYEGPISGAGGASARAGRNLGAVARIARGEIEAWTETPDEWRLRVRWHGQGGRDVVREISLARLDSNTWSLVIAPAGSRHAKAAGA